MIEILHSVHNDKREAQNNTKRKPNDKRIDKEFFL